MQRFWAFYSLVREETLQSDQFAPMRGRPEMGKGLDVAGDLGEGTDTDATRGVPHPTSLELTLPTPDQSA